MLINEAQKWPNNKKQYDFNFLKIYGYCNQQSCPKHKYCFRYQERVGRNNISWVTEQDDYSTCSFFSPAICYYCSGKGYFEDKDVKGKIIKTTCIICGGFKKLFPSDGERKKWMLKQK